MATSNRKCLCCNKHYSYCPDCSGADRLAPSWKAEFCSETCKDLWLTCTRYNMGRHTKQEAQDIIKSLPLKSVAEYVQCVQRDLGTILKEDQKSKRSKRIVAQPIDEAAAIAPSPIDETTSEVVFQENE